LSAILTLLDRRVRAAILVHRERATRPNPLYKKTELDMASRDIIDVEMLASKFKTMPKPKNPIEAKAYLNRALALQSKIDRLWNRSPAGSDDAEYGEMLAEEFEPAFRLAEDLAEKFLSRKEVNVPGKHILGKATVEDWAKVIGNAQVTDRAKVYGSATVSGNAKVYQFASVWNDAKVSENAKVYGRSKVYGDAKVSGKAHVLGNAQVYGYADISGDAVILGGKWDGSEGPITSGTWSAPDIPEIE
jgi:hypothetical protein